MPRRFRIPSVLFVALACLNPLGYAWRVNRLQPNQISSESDATATRQTLEVKYSRLPLGFERNRGQADGKTQFVSHGRGYTLQLQGSEAVLTLDKNASYRYSSSPKAEIHLRLLGSNPRAQAFEEGKLPGKSSYFIGGDPRNWVSGIENYSRVRYRAIYPGIDLVYYGNQCKIEHDFVIAPGASPGLISLGIKGARHISLSPRGDLVLSTAGGEIQLNKPVLYQEVNGRKRRVEGSFRIRGKQRVGFRVGDYDHRRQLVIDPTLSFSTFYGGFGNDEIQSIALDSAGNIYAGGGTQSPNLTLVNPIQSSRASFNDGFLLKLDPTASNILYATYIGGNGDDEVESIAVDQSGNLFATGITASSNFPTANAMQPNVGGACQTFGSFVQCPTDAFVLELNPAGTQLVYSTYLGGAGSDQGNGIAVDSADNAYVVGSTSSRDFPTLNALQPNLLTTQGNSGAFVTKLDPTGKIAYSTYLGGMINSTLGNAIAVDGNGDAFVTGQTRAEGSFPTLNSLFGFVTQGLGHPFVTELAPSGSAILYSSLFGSNFAFSSGNAIALDGSGNVYVAGIVETSSISGDTFPVVNAFQPVFGGNSQDAFVFKLNLSSNALVYSTYLGGRGNETATGIAVDNAGNAVVGGFTDSVNFPVLNPTQQDGGGVLFKSSDSGTTWVASNAGLNENNGAVVAIDPTNPNTLYIGQAQFGSSTPLSKSTDGGGSWKGSSNGISDQNITSILVTPTNTQTLYAAGPSLGVFVSTDGGATWHAANNGLSNTSTAGLAMDPVTPSILYVATGAGVFKSLDGAGTWNSASVGLPTANAGFQMRAIAGDPLHAGTLYAAIGFSGGGGVYKTSDGANSWALANSGITSTFIASLAVDPVTTTTVYAGTDAGYFKSLDGGATWTAGASQFSFDTVFAFAIDPSNDSHVLMSVAEFSFSGPKDAFVSTNGGATWSLSTFTNNLGRFTFDPTNSSTIYAAALNREDQFIARFDPNGQLLYSTYLGGTGTDEAHAVAVDASGNGLVAGFSDSANFPTTPGTIQPAIDPPSNDLGGSTEVNGSNSTVVKIGSSLSTRIVLSSDDPSVIVGNPNSVVATVTPAGATGTVTFFNGTIENGVVLGTVSLSPDATAKLFHNFAVVGSYTITARYNGNPTRGLDPSTSLPIDVFVLKDTTTSSLSTIPAGRSLLGQSVEIFAVVSASTATSGIPVGDVELFVDGNMIPLRAGLVNGEEINFADNLTAGTHVITARYLGDSNHEGSSSPVFTQTVVVPGTVNLVVSLDELVRNLTGGNWSAFLNLTNTGTDSACFGFDVDLQNATLNNIPLIDFGITAPVTHGGCGAAFEIGAGATQTIDVQFPPTAASFPSFRNSVRGTVLYTDELTGQPGSTTFSVRGVTKLLAE